MLLSLVALSVALPAQQGPDAPPAARPSWLTFRTTVPLTAEEFQNLAGNVAPYFR